MTDMSSSLLRDSLTVFKQSKHNFQIVLGFRPLQRNALARVLKQRVPVGADGLFQARRPRLALTEGP
jgi:hypothetical protein